VISRYHRSFRGGKKGGIHREERGDSRKILSKKIKGKKRLTEKEKSIEEKLAAYPAGEKGAMEWRVVRERKKKTFQMSERMGGRNTTKKKPTIYIFSGGRG